MIDVPCETIINTVVEEHFSPENKHSGIVVSGEVLKYHETPVKLSNKLKLLKE